ncbi:MAG: phosphoenolpyruvate--protein phosphotransferase, partial [Bacteroidota bacterium]
PEMLKATRLKMEDERVNAEAAFHEIVGDYIDKLENMPDEYFSERAKDIKDVRDRVLRNLLCVEDSPTGRFDKPSIILADDLVPSETINLDKALVLGFCIAKGGPTSHTAILARALGLPAVVGAGEKILDLADDTRLILDGSRGEVIVEPGDEVKANYMKRQTVRQKRLSETKKKAGDIAETIDGKTIEVGANIANVTEAEIAIENGADGVGLFRTEFLFLEHDHLPDEETQVRYYHEILDVFGDNPVKFTTLDIGGDKDIPYLNLEKEQNPFLGWRALRLSLSNPDLFRPQIRAAFLASSDEANLKFMLPMVTTISELIAAKELIQECRAQLEDEGYEIPRKTEIGVMIETPAAALTADIFAEEADFFSIGTNDLCQYTMVADRTNPKVASLASEFQPAVLLLIQKVITAGHKRGIRVGVCGEMASNPLAVPLLVGLEIDELSMNPPMIPLIKELIRSLNFAEMKKLTQGVLSMKEQKMIIETIKKEVPEIKKYL